MLSDLTPFIESSLHLAVLDRLERQRQAPPGLSLTKCEALLTNGISATSPQQCPMLSWELSSNLFHFGAFPYCREYTFCVSLHRCSWSATRVLEVRHDVVIHYMQQLDGSIFLINAYDSVSFKLHSDLTCITPSFAVT